MSEYPGFNPAPDKLLYIPRGEWSCQTLQAGLNGEGACLLS